MRRAIYQIAREPKTGVWTVMSELGKYFSSETDIVESRIIVFGPGGDHEEYEQQGIRNGVNVTYFKIPDFKFSYLSILLDKRLSKWINHRAIELNLDEVVLHFHNANLSGLFFPLNDLNDLKVSTIATFHGTPLVYPKPGRVKKFLNVLIGRRLTKYNVQLVSVDPAGIEQASRIFGYSPSQFVVIPNGIADPGVLHQPRKKSNQKFIVGFVGSFEQRKRWDLVVDAALKLVTEKYPVELWVAGMGDKATEKRIQAIAKSNPEWFSYKGNVPNAGENLIPQLDALVLPSEHEGMPMTILEAMASGVVVISTPVSGIPYMIQDGETGILVKPNVDLIVESLIKLVESPYLCSQLSKKARQEYESKFTVEICCNKYLEVYERSLS